MRTATPAGDLIAIVEDDHIVLAAGFTHDGAGLASRLSLDALPSARSGGPVAEAVARYLDGDVHALGGVATEQAGTAFQHRVWAALRHVQPGRPETYGELAARIGAPRATRAVGSACGRNLVAPFVPCHRAVRADGGAGGYLYGPQVKRWLLEHELGQR